ncbi:MAG: D-alanyl-D-alanine carboxypeptidase/D-alanyl-D-alanine-endopeptidase [Prevotella sp.]|nr:D-alanyl-D-alanine carboxypeptidase/D-alanyl-D-alanine-endopeptidase [Prevotella sp.]
MKKKLLIFLTFCFSLSLTAQTDVTMEGSLPWPRSLQARIDTILMTPLLETTQLGLMVYDLTADSTLYTYGHRQRLRPASTMKVVTAVTALARLGGDYQLKTSVYYTGTVSGRTLRGNLHVVGGMDPMFDRTDMIAFVNKIRHLGIDSIRGSILVDLSFKDDDRLGEGWCWDDDNPVLTPLLYGGKDCFVEQLTRELQRDGVVITDTPFRAPQSTHRLVASRSHSVSEVLVRMMKESDNLYAESLFYQLARTSGGRSATAKAAASQVRQMIQEIGLQPGDYRIADGSGLSLYNYVSAELEVGMLRYTWQHADLFRQLNTVLPVAGVDGTLKNRMKGTAAERNVHAKTGSVSGISSLAGFCTAPNGHELCFAIINQGVSRMSDGRNLQDRLCIAMCK